MRTVRGLCFLALGLLAVGPGCDCGSSSLGGSCETEEDCDGLEMCIQGRCVLRCPDCPDAGTEPGCTDLDGDGLGQGCSRGADCDDRDYRQTGVEKCGDNADNDCDNRVDEAMDSACMCAPGCVGTPIGPGTGMPFTPGPGVSDGVSLDDDGNLVLDSSEISQHIIWISDTKDGSVLKVDTRNFQELARYRTGPAAPVTSFFSGNDPSRSTVNLANDVYIGNRQNSASTPGSGSIVKISALGVDCPDTNGDGMRLTSTSPTNVLPWGQDDCVLWSTELPAETDRIRAVAAQDVLGPDLELIPYVWAGDWHDSGAVWVYKLDGTTGDILFRTESPVKPYGFALDADGNLWISGLDSNAIGRIDTTRCIDEASCNVEVCGAEGDTCIKQRIPVPSPAVPYGITVDFEQRVWTGIYSPDGVLRYDRREPQASRFTYIRAVSVHGIAADGKGFVYGAAPGAGQILRFDADDPANFVQINAQGDPKGMAVDAEGKIWSINMESSNATVVTPGDSINDNTVTPNVAPDLVGPYTYSDMTGLQLRLATNPRGYYRHVFEGCPEGSDTLWDALWWAADIPEGTQLVWRVRTAATREGLAAAMWIIVAQSLPESDPPIDLETKLQEADVVPQQFLEVEVALIAERSSTEEVITPVVKRIDVGRFCPGILQ